MAGKMKEERNGLPARPSGLLVRGPPGKHG